MMEKALFDALARILIQPVADQYGYIQDSPLKTAINKWATEKREDIASALMKKFKVDEFAEKVAGKVIEELVRRDIWQETYRAEELNKRVMEIVAQRLAEEQIKKLQEKVGE